jgi:PleD family two-component response regulator
LHRAAGRSLTATTAEAACERIREALLLACVEANMPSFTTSFGVTDSSMGSELGELFRIADEALYEAKDQGRNRSVIGRNQTPGGRHTVEHPATMRSSRIAES